MDQIGTVLGSSGFQNFDSLSKNEQIADVSKKFEAVLFRKFLGDAMKPVFKTFMSNDNNANSVYRYFFVDSIAQSIASTSPLKIEQVFAQDKSIAERVKDK